MALPTLVQSATAASAAAGPTSITPTLGVASTPGNLLILQVVVTGTSPTITVPAGWTGLGSSGPTGLIHRAMAIVNNPGGITAVAVTIGGTGGGAVASIFEFSGGSVHDGTTQAQSLGSTSYASPALPTTSNVEELIFQAIGFAATTLTPANSNEWGAVVGATVSTNGTPNAQIACFWGISGESGKATIGGTFGVSVVNSRLFSAFIVSGTQQLTYNNVGGQSGQLVGQFFQGMIGG